MCTSGGAGGVTEKTDCQFFLSASFPSGKRGQEVAPYDAGAIADAITAFVRAVFLSGGQLVFGGHPTITPLVLLMGVELDAAGRVDIFQSLWFEDQITSETWRLVESGIGRIHWTERRETLEISLSVMRDEMFRSTSPVAAVFVGGMSGIADEYLRFGNVHPTVPRLALAGPGGAAARLPVDDVPRELRPHLSSRHYPFVASQIVGYFMTLQAG